MKKERTILNSLLNNDLYFKEVYPFLRADYFSGSDNYVEKELFKSIVGFVSIYNKPPTVDALKLMISDSSKDTEIKKESIEVLNEISSPLNVDLEFLLKDTEKFCKQMALENAIITSMEVIQGTSKKKQDVGSIPDIIREALSVSFDVNIGHDYTEDAEKRWEFYHSHVDRLPFDVEALNRVTGGGVPKKTLNVIVAGPNVGKSLAMCHLATHYLKSGKNVLYITMEMAEERISERIDANCLDMPLSNLKDLDKATYLKLMNNFKKNHPLGKLIVHEYPTVGASVLEFRRLLAELELKKAFKPDVIFVDYLNICASSRMKQNGTINSYTYIKAISEELRALGQEMECPIWTAAQVNRTNFSNSDMDMTGIAESFGINATADFILAIITTEELERMGKFLMKQLKNRYSDVTQNKRFYVGVDRSRMRLLDLGNDSEDTFESDEKQRGILDKGNENKFGGFYFGDEE